MEANKDYTDDFMQIAKVMVQNSRGKLRLAYQEKSSSQIYDEEAQHFLKLNGVRVREDIETYGRNSIKDIDGHALPSFLFLIHEIRMDCPDSYYEGMLLLYKVGKKVFRSPILQNWDRIFQHYLGP